ncbi:hypothetical protein ACFSJY_03710 [Thalassotalea euphylliae]|uniref:hypothetical protein n=1 Tax=Thalassotalea euphylliae TaxID=1655234 RepID=UPI003624E6FB
MPTNQHKATASKSTCTFIVAVLVLLIVSLFPVQAMATESLAVFSLNHDLKPLTKNKVRMLFRGKTKKLQGKKVMLSDWPEQHTIRTEFYLQLLGKDNAQMNAHWASLSFSGKARPPKELNNDSMDELIMWLSENPSSIGYAPLDMLPENANVLYVVDKESK